MTDPSKERKRGSSVRALITDAVADGEQKNPWERTAPPALLDRALPR